MAELVRYDHEYDGMWQAVGGAYVFYEDVATLEASCAAMKAALEDALVFVEDELTVRKQSYLPEESPYIDDANRVIDRIGAAIAQAEKG